MTATSVFLFRDIALRGINSKRLRKMRRGR